VDITTFATVKQPTLRCDRWFDRINSTKGNGKNRSAWKGKGNQREAEVAQSFGLKALMQRASSASTSTLRAHRALEEAGFVFPPGVHNGVMTAGGYRIYPKSVDHRFEPLTSRGPTTFRVYKKIQPNEEASAGKERLLPGVG
jgi:hypothetical protein